VDKIDGPDEMATLLISISIISTFLGISGILWYKIRHSYLLNTEF
jgi:hypothetical protein